MASSLLTLTTNISYLGDMTQLNQFLSVIKSEFPEDRLTYQKAVPTFHPETAEDAARLFQLANRHKQPIFITGFGNNIDPQGKPFTEMVSVRTDRLNKLIEIAPEDFYVTTGSGYPLKEINVHLEDEKLWLPHSSLPYVGSVGGAIAAGLSASFDNHDFPLRKYFIKATVVTPEGEIIEPGSVCFKSVSGYEIVKIFSGSWGLLGFIVSASFRVMPLSAETEYDRMLQKPLEREALLKALDETNDAVDAVYSRKIKARFDPARVLPVV
ncbi:MAG: FAD-binding oxidoreductase [Candidatus Zixiibacteriota bacterium]|nr:MAG: FAD-binding oxidoreductase [candidate division Zixibacteria bacterium]